MEKKRKLGEIMKTAVEQTQEHIKDILTLAEALDDSVISGAYYIRGNGIFLDGSNDHIAFRCPDGEFRVAKSAFSRLEGIIFQDVFDIPRYDNQATIKLPLDELLTCIKPMEEEKEELTVKDIAEFAAFLDWLLS